MGDQTYKMKAMYEWTFDFGDGVFKEVNIISEGDEPATLEGELKIYGDTLKRQGAMAVTIEELTDDKLIIGNLGGKLEFERVKE
ncbi:MAG: hypothetical protein C0594_13070 [Marinilabiliales bacterium]|nr:MAG: hypothetical protein C0594_13070 [Marinilabiliales bacterium]